MDELNRSYQELRCQLDAAYEAPQWDRDRIDRIASDLAQVERALAQRAPIWAPIRAPICASDLNRPWE